MLRSQGGLATHHMRWITDLAATQFRAGNDKLVKQPQYIPFKVEVFYAWINWGVTVRGTERLPDRRISMIKRQNAMTSRPPGPMQNYSQQK